MPQTGEFNADDINQAINVLKSAGYLNQDPDLLKESMYLLPIVGKGKISRLEYSARSYDLAIRWYKLLEDNSSSLDQKTWQVLMKTRVARFLFLAETELSKAIAHEINTNQNVNIDLCAQYLIINNHSANMQFGLGPKIVADRVLSCLDDVNQNFNKVFAPEQIARIFLETADYATINNQPFFIREQYYEYARRNFKEAFAQGQLSPEMARMYKRVLLTCAELNEICLRLAIQNNEENEVWQREQAQPAIQLELARDFPQHDPAADTDSSFVSVSDISTSMLTDATHIERLSDAEPHDSFASEPEKAPEPPNLPGFDLFAKQQQKEVIEPVTPGANSKITHRPKKS